jgi:hypothetical protein
VTTFVTPTYCFGNSAISIAKNGDVAILGGFNSSGPITYSVWNSGTNCYSVPANLTYGGSNVNAAHVADCISLDGTIIVDGWNPVRYCTLTWSGNTPTVTSAWNNTTIGGTNSNWGKALIGGNASTAPSYLLASNSGGAPFGLYKWTGSGFTLVTDSGLLVSGWGGGTQNGLGYPAGTNGNIIYTLTYNGAGNGNFSIIRTTLSVS